DPICSARVLPAPSCVWSAACAEHATKTQQHQTHGPRLLMMTPLFLKMLISARPQIVSSYRCRHDELAVWTRYDRPLGLGTANVVKGAVGRRRSPSPLPNKPKVLPSAAAATNSH